MAPLHWLIESYEDIYVFFTLILVENAEIALRQLKAINFKNIAVTDNDS